MTSYRLVFRGKAAKEWSKLGATIRRQLEKKLAERLQSPRVPGDRLYGYPGCYKIKLRDAGYRLIYRVEEDRLVLLVVKIGKRERGESYQDLDSRLRSIDDRG